MTNKLPDLPDPIAIEDAYLESIDVDRDSFVPDYFPVEDHQTIQELVEHNLDLIDRGYDHYDLLWPAHAPDSIGQSYFAISDDTPLKLQGVGPCLGVILMNEDTGRTLVAHLEARTEDTSDIEKEAEYFSRMLWSLFKEAPSRVVLSSMLGGEPYHDKVKNQLEKIYGEEIPDYDTSAVLDVDPRTRSIKTTELWQLIATQKTEENAL